MIDLSEDDQNVLIDTRKMTPKIFGVTHLTTSIPVKESDFAIA